MVAILDACNAADRLGYINTVEEVAWVPRATHTRKAWVEQRRLYGSF